MNDPNFERLKKTLYCGQADRVPIAEVLIDEEVKEAFMGKPVNNLSEDIEFYLKAGYDYVLLGRRIAGFPPLSTPAKLHNYYDAQKSLGHGTMSGICNSWHDFKEYPWMKKEDLDFRILDEAEKILPKEMKVIRYIGPIFQIAWMLMGFEKFSYKLIEDPKLIEAIIDKIFQLVYWELQDAVQREVVGAIWYLDDIAIKDRLMVSPVFLRKILFPRLKILGDECKKKNIPFIYHTDGDVSSIIEDIIEIGFCALHPIDPTAMDIFNLKEKVKNKLCLIGNVDIDMLIRGTPEQIYQDTLRHIKCLAPNGGYAIGSSNSISRDVNIENYKMLLKTALEFGKYPISINFNNC